MTEYLIPSLRRYRCERMRHAMPGISGRRRHHRRLVRAPGGDAQPVGDADGAPASGYRTRVQSRQLAALLRSYTTGFVIDEQAFLELKASDEWDSLVQQITDSGHLRPAEADDVIAILTGDRDRQFNTGLDMILAGLVRATPTPSN
jgi:hypothetical protein